MASALLGCLQHLPPATDHASMVRALLLAPPAGLASHAAGRQALRQGVLRWQATHAGSGPMGGAALAAAAADPAQVRRQWWW